MAQSIEADPNDPRQFDIEDALREPTAAIAEHQRRTGWTGPMMLAPHEMTVEEWMAENGRTTYGGG